MKKKTRHKWQAIVAAIVVSVYALWAPRLKDAQETNVETNFKDAVARTWSPLARLFGSTPSSNP